MSVCDEVIEPTTSAKNIGVTLDPTMSTEKQTSATRKTAFLHLRNLSPTRKYISTQSAATLVHDFVKSRLDFCNSLYYGLPNRLIKKLQNVQNVAARLISLSRKHDHITSLLKELHRLPVEYRIQIQILLLTFKCINNTAPVYLHDQVRF